MTGLRGGIFTIETLFDGKVGYQGFTDGCTWNGWATPVFEYVMTKHILKEMGYPYRVLTGHVIEFTDEMGDTITLEPMTVKLINGQSRNVYHLGTGYWIWQEWRADD